MRKNIESPSILDGFIGPVGGIIENNKETVEEQIGVVFDPELIDLISFTHASWIMKLNENENRSLYSPSLHSTALSLAKHKYFVESTSVLLEGQIILSKFIRI